ncbi:MAG: hypothetical protein WC938_00400 [Candidatus Paceibacterota bacterium]|jgi:hypothetical protein
MWINNFLINVKIGFIDSQAEKILSKILKELESNSVKQTIELINSEGFEKANKNIEKFGNDIQKLIEVKEKYIQLREKYKNDKSELLKIAIDWRDAIIFNYDTLINKTDEKIDYKIRTKTIINKFNDLLLK